MPRSIEPKKSHVKACSSVRNGGKGKGRAIDLSSPTSSTSIPSKTYVEVDSTDGEDEGRRGKGKARTIDTSSPTSSTSIHPYTRIEVNSSDSGKKKAKSRATDYDDDTQSPSSTTPTSTPTPKPALDEQDDEWCLICHSTPLSDRTVLPLCLHSQFCFSCIVRWCSIKRRCPLCQAEVGEYVVHGIRADDDYLRYWLPPLPSSTSTTPLSSTSATPLGSAASVSAAAAGASASRRRIVSEVQRSRQQRRSEGPSELEREEREERALERRKHIYRHNLYAAHVGSNRHTLYTPAPSPAQIRSCADLQRRIMLFLHRELKVWAEVDADWLAGYILSLLKVFDLRSDEMGKLVGEWLGERVGRHLLHELESWLRSGKRELRFWDESPLLQYPKTQDSGTERRRRKGEGSRTRLGGNNSSHSAGPKRRRDVLLSSTTDGSSHSTHGDDSQLQAQSQPRIDSGSSDGVAESRGGGREDVALRRERLLQKLERERALLTSTTAISSDSIMDT